MEKIDPVEGANKVSYEVIEGVDKALIGPIMHVYRDGIPRPIRLGLHNFFFNLTEPTNAINYMLQLHPGKAARVVARFAINSTVGIGGLLDVARNKPFHIYYRPNGFGNTFGYWGIPTGPYLFLPLVGPTSARDVIGSLLDQAVLPAIAPKLFKNYYYVISAGLITELDYRVDIDAGVERVRKTGNPYASYRQAYLKSRYEEIEALHGRGPLANGEIGQPPFVRPLFPESGGPPAPDIPSKMTPSTAAPAPVAAAPPPAALAPAELAPTTPPPPVFVSHPVVQPHPTVQPLPPGYRPGGS
jgi:phospholipid-binding lipoprotein MlaA